MMEPMMTTSIFDGVEANASRLIPAHICAGAASSFFNANQAFEEKAGDVGCGYLALSSSALIVSLPKVAGAQQRPSGNTELNAHGQS
jgi:hypothetical protein